MAMSHTGALTGDAWVYEQAFRQAGIICAGEIDELVDRVQFLEQLPASMWTPVRGLFVLTGTGGFAAMAADLADEEGVDIPEVDRLSDWISWRGRAQSPGHDRVHRLAAGDPGCRHREVP
jgi:acyl-CoA synthetase (NDP forming)